MTALSLTHPRDHFVLLTFHWLLWFVVSGAMMVTPFFCLGETCPSFLATHEFVPLLMAPEPFFLRTFLTILSLSESCSSSMGEMVWSLSSWSERLSSLPRALSFAGEPSKYSSSSFRAGCGRVSGTPRGRGGAGSEDC